MQFIFGLPQNILGPVEGQGIIVLFLSDKYKVYLFMMDPFLIKKVIFVQSRKVARTAKANWIFFRRIAMHFCTHCTVTQSVFNELGNEK